jgi:hypothetical protein
MQELMRKRTAATCQESAATVVRGSMPAKRCRRQPRHRAAAQQKQSLMMASGAFGTLGHRVVQDGGQ